MITQYGLVLVRNKVCCATEDMYGAFDKSFGQKFQGRVKLLFRVNDVYSNMRINLMADEKSFIP